MSRGSVFALSWLGLLTLGSCSRAVDEYAGDCPEDPKICSNRCVSRSDPSFGCSADSCSPCSLPNADPTCAGDACSVGACDEGFADCDGLPQNGCEIAISNDVENCGACDFTCDGNAAFQCAEGACVVQQCEDGFGDCDGLPDNGCEQDLATPDHCGACEASCLGANCLGDALCERVIVYQGQLPVAGIAVDETHLYFSGLSPQLHRVPRDAVGLTDGAPELEMLFDGGAQTLDLAVDGQYVYWADLSGGIYRANKGVVPLQPEALSGSFTNPAGMHIVGDTLYWTNLGPPGDPAAGLWSTNLATLEPSPYLVGCGPSCDAIADVAADEQRLYYTVFTQSGAIRSVTEPSDPAPIEWYGEVNPRFLAIDPSFVFWTTDSNPGGALRYATRQLLDANNLATGLNFPSGVALDDEAVYFGEIVGRRLMKIRKPLQ